METAEEIKKRAIKFVIFFGSIGVLFTLVGILSGTRLFYAGGGVSFYFLLICLWYGYRNK